MRAITDVELPAHIDEVLSAVDSGDTVRVTAAGQVVALFVPPPRDPIADLIATGHARPALSPRRFSRIVRERSAAPGVLSEEIEPHDRA